MASKRAVRIALLADADRIRAHFEEVNGEETPWFRGPGNIEAGAFRNALEENLTTRFSRVAVVEDAGEIVAVGFVARRGDAHADASMSVNPSARQQGHGEALLRFLVAWAREQDGLERLYGKVMETNVVSLGMCHKVGFVEDTANGLRLKRSSARPALLTPAAPRTRAPT